MADKKPVIILVIALIILLVLVGVWRFGIRPPVDQSSTVVAERSRPITPEEQNQIRASLQFATSSRVLSDSPADQKIKQDIINSLENVPAPTLGIKEVEGILKSLNSK